MDPYAKESRRQNYSRKDTITYPVKAAECLNWDDVVARKKQGSRLVWRPPKDYITKVGGVIHSDDRGLFAKYIGHKVVFKNKLNAPLRIKATVPVGKIGDPSKIFARPFVADISADPTGNKKDLSRKKGKKGAKNYSKATDRIEINVSEKDLFTGDANLYSLFVEKLPGDKTITPSYYANGFVLLDYIPILPNQNQYTDKVFNPDLVVMEIVIVVRYIISRLVPADGSESSTVKQFHKASLANLDAVFHVDEEQYLSQQLGQLGLISPGHSAIRQLEDHGYPYVGVKNKHNKLLLCNYDVDRNPTIPAELTSLEGDSCVRLVIPGLHVKEPKGEVLTSEFGYDSEERSWVLFDGDQPRIVDGDVGVDVDGKVVSASIPVHVFTTVRRCQPGLALARDGLIRNYGNNLTYAISWDQIAQGLSVVLKVLPLVIQIGGAIF